MTPADLRPAFVAAAELARRNAGPGLPAKLARKAIAATAYTMLDALPLTQADRAALMAAYVGTYHSTPLNPAPTRATTTPITTDEE